jgi:3-hydroxyisobutyrate dehydrogenase-like beta-hydroxyacid dehydrogenase
MMCVGNDHDVRAVALGKEGALQAMQKGAVLVDHTTASAELAREAHAAAAARGVGFDARCPGSPAPKREAHDHGGRRCCGIRQGQRARTMESR